MPGLVPGIHAFKVSWALKTRVAGLIPGSSPGTAMTFSAAGNIDCPVSCFRNKKGARKSALFIGGET